MVNIFNVNQQNATEQLAAQGRSLRRIARELGIDRKTVRRYFKPRAKSPTISPPGSGVAQTESAPISTPEEPQPAADQSCGAQLAAGARAAEVGRPSQCEVHRICIEAKLEAGLSAQRIYQDLVGEAGFSGSYQSVKRFVRRLRQRQPERVWRIEVEPGEEVQI